MRLALHQPDQAGNVGTIMRLAACVGVPVDIIEPCGFPWGDRALKRAGMDYAEVANVTRHASWEDFQARIDGRLVLLTTAGDVRLDEAGFEAGDVVLLGSESAGVPANVHRQAALRVRIPQAPGTRSLNVAVAAGIVLAEALRQTNSWPLGGESERGRAVAGDPGGGQEPVDFVLRKYERDRDHELELNKFSHALEVERLKVLQLVNGGAFAVLVAFADAIIASPDLTRFLAVGAAICWVVGLGAGAWASQRQLDAQSKFSQAYRFRRNAVEWDRLAVLHEAQIRSKLADPLKKQPTDPDAARQLAQTLRRIVGPPRGRSRHSPSDRDFDVGARWAYQVGKRHGRSVEYWAVRSFLFFAVGALLAASAIAITKASPPAAELTGVRIG